MIVINTTTRHDQQRQPNTASAVDWIIDLVPAAETVVAPRHLEDVAAAGELHRVFRAASSAAVPRPPHQEMNRRRNVMPELTIAARQVCAHGGELRGLTHRCASTTDSSLAVRLPRRCKRTIFGLLGLAGSRSSSVASGRSVSGWIFSRRIRRSVPALSYRGSDSEFGVVASWWCRFVGHAWQCSYLPETRSAVSYPATDLRHSAGVASWSASHAAPQRKPGRRAPVVLRSAETTAQ